MAGATNILLFNGSRRIRCLCTGALAASAFTSLAYYAVTNTDGLGASPDVNAVFAIASTPNAFELSVDCDLTPGALYALAVIALPFADSSTYSGALQSRVPSNANTPDPQAEPATSDFDLYYYGRDLALNDGGGIGIGANGDLATKSGRRNWTGAILRRAMSGGLPWDPSYGARPNEYVNAPPQQQLPLAAQLVAQARADDRTLSAQVTLTPAPGATTANPGGSTSRFAFLLSVQGRDGLSPASLNVPAPNSGP